MIDTQLRDAAANSILEAIRKRAEATTAADQLKLLAEAYALVNQGGHSDRQ